MGRYFHPSPLVSPRPSRDLMERDRHLAIAPSVAARPEGAWPRWWHPWKNHRRSLVGYYGEWWQCQDWRRLGEERGDGLRASVGSMSALVTILAVSRQSRETRPSPKTLMASRNVKDFTLWTDCNEIKKRRKRFNIFDVAGYGFRLNRRIYHKFINKGQVILIMPRIVCTLVLHF